MKNVLKSRNERGKADLVNDMVGTADTVNATKFIPRTNSMQPVGGNSSTKNLQIAIRESAHESDDGKMNQIYLNIQVEEVSPVKSASESTDKSERSSVRGSNMSDGEFDTSIKSL